MSPTFTPRTTPIDIQVPLLIKNNGSYYEFMENFIILSLIILIGRGIVRLRPDNRKEL